MPSQFDDNEYPRGFDFYDPRLSNGFRTWARDLFGRFVDDIHGDEADYRISTGETVLSRRHRVEGVVWLFERGLLKIIEIGGVYGIACCDPDEAPQLHGPLSFAWGDIKKWQPKK